MGQFILTFSEGRPAPNRKCPQRGIILHRGRGSTAHAQTSPCYSIGAFVINSPKTLFTIKTPPKSQKNAPTDPFYHQNAPQRARKMPPQTLFSVETPPTEPEKCPPEPFLPPKNTTRMNKLKHLLPSHK